MPASRSRQWVIVPKGMYPEVRRHLPTSKLAKGIAPTWSDVNRFQFFSSSSDELTWSILQNPEWTQDNPTGEWATKCVDRWCCP
ncbi:unnamed protein product [Rhizoctonia solani]|uniref:Uncharacterized protein n=1 Tax=Rhizoctonia solani TaxID=456999 RepID=A0A8H2WT65_9AGAM|nr:unnamed protein product [Rhizoctonia solani]